MVKLNHDWLTEGLIDFEYKKYILLSYIKDVRKNFDRTCLYPFLGDLIFHYGNLQKIKEKKQLMYDQFPSTLSKNDVEKLKVNYKKIIEDDEVMKEMEEILSYAIPIIDRTINQGKEIYDFVEEQMELSPVGLTPLYDKEGYLFINKDSSRDVSIYKYSISVFENASDKYRGINTTYIGEDFQDLSRSYEKIKLDLVKTFKELPNPASFLVLSKLKFPETPTILPIAKRLLMKQVSFS